MRHVVGRDDPLKNSTPSNLGLVANGTSGSWSIDLDETLSGASKWFLQMTGPSMYLNFEVAGPDVVDLLVHFIESRLARRDEGNEEDFNVGHFGQSPVLFLWDAEGSGRGVVLVSGRGGSKMRFEMPRDDVECFADALRQVRDDLYAEGLCSAAPASNIKSI